VAEPTTTAPATDLATYPSTMTPATHVARSPAAAIAWAARHMLITPAIGWSRVPEET
jgi:hypothetical protein